ncbi:hypothetical protein WCLP8_1460006 [uncultured Gammaproteobacteria bacterium]
MPAALNLISEVVGLKPHPMGGEEGRGRVPGASPTDPRPRGFAPWNPTRRPKVPWPPFI